jgi:hypothetical protein
MWSTLRAGSYTLWAIFRPRDPLRGYPEGYVRYAISSPVPLLLLSPYETFPQRGAGCLTDLCVKV